MTTLAALRSRLFAAVAAAESICLFSDFDGTLTPLQDTPDACRLDEPTRLRLSRLAAHPRCAVGLISGRALDDLRSRALIEHAAYAGNHGLEIAFGDQRHVQPAAAAIIDRLRELEDLIRRALHDDPAVWIENKTLSLSIHYRRAPVERHAELRRRLLERFGAAITRAGGIVREGHCVLEVRPDTPWTKGHATRMILSAIAKSPNPSTLYFGDDLSDEDVFAEFPDGWTVRVGFAGESRARHRVATQPEILALLEVIDTALAG